MSDNLTPAELDELARLVAAFEIHGRHVELAERIDYLRTKRDGVNVVVEITVDDLLHMTVEEFEEVVGELVTAERGGGGGVISAYTLEVEDVEDRTTLAVRVKGDWE